jgi:site-specific DNA-methyltransferase (adenine-specific)
LKYKLNNIYNEDCLQAMKQIPDKYFDLAIVDPPYGISITDSGRLSKYNASNKRWDDCIPNDDYFNELFRISKNQIIWGGNYFKLPPTRCFLIWDKKQPEGVSFASCEYAWTNFDKSAKTFYYSPLKDNSNRFHPTQKPVALYEWLLNNYAKKGDRILDTHLGSASSIIACKKLGFEYMGFEIDKEYFDKASERIAKFESQTNLFEILNEQPKPKQESLF